MKLLNLAILGLLSVSILAGGATVFAEEVKKIDTNGQITFTPNGDEAIVVIPPGITDPPVVIPPIVEPNTGPLTIAYAPTMNFGNQVISNQDQTYNVIAEMQTLAEPEEGGPTEIPYVSFAQVQDIRGSNAGWDLQVSLSNFTSTTQNNILIGAQINLDNPFVKHEGTNQTNAPSAHTTSLMIIPGAGAVSVMTADEGKGAGVSSVVWGDQEDLLDQFEDDTIENVKNGAIQLSVPGSTAKDATIYTSVLSWELTTTPDTVVTP